MSAGWRAAPAPPATPHHRPFRVNRPSTPLQVPRPAADTTGDAGRPGGDDVLTTLRQVAVAVRPPVQLLARLRWFFLAFVLFFAVTFLPQLLLQSTWPVPTPPCPRAPTR